MRTGTVVILLIVMIAVGFLAEVDAKCYKRDCSYKCRQRGCRKSTCFLWRICVCRKCAVESPVRDQSRWLSTGLGDDIAMGDDFINDEMNHDQ